MTAGTSDSPSEDTWHRVADVGELSDGAVKGAVAAGRPVVLVCLGGRYGALDGRCPHAGGPLADGTIENGLLVCPWHGREYDPFSGQCEGYVPVRSYQVEVRPDGVYVAV
jgi:nitrite reductase/ring-hydroxylating ferredoxin subunit